MLWSTGPILFPKSHVLVSHLLCFSFLLRPKAMTAPPLAAACCYWKPSLCRTYHAAWKDWHHHAQIVAGHRCQHGSQSWKLRGGGRRHKGLPDTHVSRCCLVTFDTLHSYFNIQRCTETEKGLWMLEERLLLLKTWLKHQVEIKGSFSVIHSYNQGVELNLNRKQYPNQNFSWNWTWTEPEWKKIITVIVLAWNSSSNRAPNRKEILRNIYVFSRHTPLVTSRVALRARMGIDLGRDAFTTELGHASSVPRPKLCFRGFAESPFLLELPIQLL